MRVNGEQLQPDLEEPAVRKKKTPTQLRRERKKRQRERERRQREMEKRVADRPVRSQAVSVRRTQQPLSEPNPTGKSSHDSYSSDSLQNAGQNENLPPPKEQRKKKKKKWKTKGEGLGSSTPLEIDKESLKEGPPVAEMEKKSKELSSDSENGKQAGQNYDYEHKPPQAIRAENVTSERTESQTELVSEENAGHRELLEYTATSEEVHDDQPTKLTTAEVGTPAGPEEATGATLPEGAPTGEGRENESAVVALRPEHVIAVGVAVLPVRQPGGEQEPTSLHPTPEREEQEPTSLHPTPEREEQKLTSLHPTPEREEQKLTSLHPTPDRIPAVSAGPGQEGKEQILLVQSETVCTQDDPSNSRDESPAAQLTVHKDSNTTADPQLLPPKGATEIETLSLHPVSLDHRAKGVECEAATSISITQPPPLQGQIELGVSTEINQLLPDKFQMVKVSSEEKEDDSCPKSEGVPLVTITHPELEGSEVRAESEPPELDQPESQPHQPESELEKPESELDQPETEPDRPGGQLESELEKPETEPDQPQGQPESELEKPESELEQPESEPDQPEHEPDKPGSGVGPKSSEPRNKDATIVDSLAETIKQCALRGGYWESLAASDSSNGGSGRLQVRGLIDSSHEVHAEEPLRLRGRDECEERKAMEGLKREE